MAMIDSIPAITFPSFPARLRFSQAALRICASLIARYRRYRLEKQLARLVPETLADIGVPHDRMTAATGELNRYPNVIKVKVRRI